MKEKDAGISNLKNKLNISVAQPVQTPKLIEMADEKEEVIKKAH